MATTRRKTAAMKAAAEAARKSGKTTDTSSQVALKPRGDLHKDLLGSLFKPAANSQKFDTFTVFPKLTVENGLLIWKASCDIRFPTVFPKDLTCIIGGGVRSPRLLPGFMSSSNTAELVRACRESREVGLKELLYYLFTLDHSKSLRYGPQTTIEIRRFETVLDNPHAHNLFKCASKIAVDAKWLDTSSYGTWIAKYMGHNVTKTIYSVYWGVSSIKECGIYVEAQTNALHKDQTGIKILRTSCTHYEEL